MSLEITPAIPVGRQLIQSYSKGGFRVGGIFYHGSIIVFKEKTKSWSITAPGEISSEMLKTEISSDEYVEILLIGCGKVSIPPPKELGTSLKEQNIVLEWMTTDAACRTFNVLLVEDRPVAAALIAV